MNAKSPKARFRLKKRTRPPCNLLYQDPLIVDHFPGTNFLSIAQPSMDGAGECQVVTVEKAQVPALIEALQKGLKEIDRIANTPAQ
jgi:hypothetical protein